MSRLASKTVLDVVDAVFSVYLPVYLFMRYPGVLQCNIRSLSSDQLCTSGVLHTADNPLRENNDNMTKITNNYKEKK